MALRLFLLALGTILALSAFGLWVTESRGGPETDAASFYLLAVGIALAMVVVGGLAFMFTRRTRPRDPADPAGSS
jgi:hypothetical protein